MMIIVLQGSEIAPDLKREKHDKWHHQHHPVPLIGTELHPTLSMNTADDTWKDDEHVAWSSRLRITL